MSKWPLLASCEWESSCFHSPLKRVFISHHGQDVLISGVRNSVCQLEGSHHIILWGVTTNPRTWRKSLLSTVMRALTMPWPFWWPLTPTNGKKSRSWPLQLSMGIPRSIMCSPTSFEPWMQAAVQMWVTVDPNFDCLIIQERKMAFGGLETVPYLKGVVRNVGPFQINTNLKTYWPLSIGADFLSRDQTFRGKGYRFVHPFFDAWSSMKKSTTLVMFSSKSLLLF